jgi:histidinol phosphatase-like PHP family hydrolase
MNQPVFDPFLIMLDMIAESGALITIGSDAHEPRNVAKSFPELKKVLHDKNILQHVIFSGMAQIVRNV